MRSSCGDRSLRPLGAGHLSAVLELPLVCQASQHDKHAGQRASVTALSARPRLSETCLARRALRPRTERYALVTRSRRAVGDESPAEGRDRSQSARNLNGLGSPGNRSTSQLSPLSVTENAGTAVGGVDTPVGTACSAVAGLPNCHATAVSLLWTVRRRRDFLLSNPTAPTPCCRPYGRPCLEEAALHRRLL